MSYAFFVQYTNLTVSALEQTDFRLAIVDKDATRGAAGPIGADEIAALQRQGKRLIAYLSIGEAETYRPYWQEDWEPGNPPWIIAPNPNWQNNYYVEFWDPEWQTIVQNMLLERVHLGFNGVFLDVVDVYSRPEVQDAAGGRDEARDYMRQFVTNLSATAKAVNRSFKLIQNNAQDLFTVDPDDHTSAPNTSYLNAIDGALAETTWYMPDGLPTTWGEFNAGYMDKAVAAGKTMLALEYCPGIAERLAFVSKSLQRGFVPFVAGQDLNALDAWNERIAAQLSVDAMRSLLTDG